LHPRLQSGEHEGSPLHRVIQWFKTMTTNHYIRGVRKRRWNSFRGRYTTCSMPFSRFPGFPAPRCVWHTGF
jgi:hypothetical protein